MFTARVLLYAPDEDAGGAEEFNARGEDVTPKGFDPAEAAADADAKPEDDAGGNTAGNTHGDDLGDDSNQADDAGGDTDPSADVDPLAGLTDRQREWVDFGENQAKEYTPNEVYDLANAGHAAKNSPPKATPRADANTEDDDDDGEPVTRKQMQEAINQGHIAGQKQAAFDSLVAAHPELNTKAQYAIKGTIALLEQDHPDATPAQIAQSAMETVVGGAIRVAQSAAENVRQQHVNRKLQAKSTRNVPAGRSSGQRQTAQSKLEEELDNDPNAINSGRILAQIEGDQAE